MAERKQSMESGRIKLPRGTTANERAKANVQYEPADTICQNCRKTWRDDQLAEITHGFWERVSPGDIMPSGECPDCGSLCTPIQKPIPVTVRLTVIGGVAEAYKVPKGIRVEVRDYDCDAIADAADVKRDRNGDRYLLKVWEGN